jgi:hypothetical protein
MGSKADSDHAMKVIMNWDNPNKAEAMQLFKQQCEMVFRRKKIADKQDQVDEILLRAGEKGLKKFNSWGLSDDDKKDPKEVWKKFEDYGKSNQNFRVARLSIQNMKQLAVVEPNEEEEPVDEFMSRLRLQTRLCDYRTKVVEGETNCELDEKLIELLIAGTLYTDVQKELLAKDKSLKLEAAMQVARNHEASLIHMKQLKATQSVPQSGATTVAAIQKGRKGPSRGMQCQKCGKKHFYKDRCPAHGAKCHNCGRMNHWASVCKNDKQKHTPRESAPPQRNKPYKQGKKYHTICQVDDEEEQDELSFAMVEVGAKDCREEVFAKIDIKVPGRDHKPANLSAKVDTGAQGNILPLRIFNAMCPKPTPGVVQKSKAILTAYNGSQIPQSGVMKLPCKYENSELSTESFFIADTDGPAILGLPTSR